MIRMTKSNVIYMATVRDLLIEWDKVRSDILAGEALGWGGTVQYKDREVVYLGGSFRESAADRARAMLKVSAARMMREDPPLPSLKIHP